MSAIEALGAFVEKATIEYRKGPVVTANQVGNVRVAQVYAMPPASEAAGHVTVDVGFVVVGFSEYAADRETFERLLVAAIAEPGVYQSFTPEQFLAGPSYITTGGWIGSQDLALRLYALLEHYGLAEVVTPQRLHVTDPKQVATMLGAGFVMFAFKPELRERLGG